MASLTGASIASSYTSLLKLNGNADTLVGGASGNAIQVVDGDGTGSNLYLNTDRFGIGTHQPGFPLHVKADSGSAIALFENAGSSSPSGLYLNLSGGTPNDRTDYYFFATGGGGDISLYTDGGASFAGRVDIVQTTTTATSTPKALFIDTNLSGDAAQDSTGLHLDFDRTVAGSGTAAHNDIGINLDVNSASLGTSSLVGMDIDVTGASSGTSTATGINVNVSGADTNYAAVFTGGNVGIGTATPASILHLDSTATTNLKVEGANTGTTLNTVSERGGSINLYNTSTTNNNYMDIGFWTGASDDSGSRVAQIVGSAQSHGGGSGKIYLRIADSTTLYTAMTLANSGAVANASFQGNILPMVDDSKDIGTSSLRFDDIYASSGTVNSSDKRLKDNIADSSLGLNFIKALRPVEYKFKNYNYDIEKEEAVKAKDAIYETVVIQEAVEAKEAIMGTRQKTVSKEVEKSKTEIIEEDGKYIQKEVLYTETIKEPQYKEVDLYDKDNKVIGSHRIPIMEEYEVEPEIKATEEITEKKLISEATEAKDAVVETKEKTYVRKHFGLLAQEVEQVLKDSSLTNNDFAGLIYDQDADRYGLRYHELISPLIKAVQELSAKVTALENK